MVCRVQPNGSTKSMKSKAELWLDFNFEEQPRRRYFVRMPSKRPLVAKASPPAKKPRKVAARKESLAEDEASQPIGGNMLNVATEYLC